MDVLKNSRLKVSEAIEAKEVNAVIEAFGMHFDAERPVIVSELRSEACRRVPHFSLFFLSPKVIES